MNDEGALHRRPRQQLSRRFEITTEASRLTPLQQYVVALGDIVRDSRDVLTPQEFSWFITVVTELVGLEAARLFAGEALRATRAKDEAA